MIPIPLRLPLEVDVQVVVAYEIKELTKEHSAN